MCRHNKKQEIDSSPWNDLCEDILELITKRLQLTDQIHASVVCKDWYANIGRIGTRVRSRLPWAYYYMWEYSNVSNNVVVLKSMVKPTVKDDLRPREYFLVETNYNCRKIATIETQVIGGPEPCASKQGWLLFAKKLKVSTKFFLYNPFSNRSISIPYLKYHYDAASFSKNPNSPDDCVIFAFYRGGGGRTCVATYSLGKQEKWCTHLVSEDPSHKILNVVYNEEKNEFYCALLNANLARFEVAGGRWSLLTYNNDPLETLARELIGMKVALKREWLVEHKGQLLWILSFGNSTYGALRFDWSETKWRLVKNDDSDGLAMVFLNNPSLYLKKRVENGSANGDVCKFKAFRPKILNRHCLHLRSGVVNGGTICAFCKLMKASATAPKFWLEPPWQESRGC